MTRKELPRFLRRKRKTKKREYVCYYYDGRDEHGKRKEIPLGTDFATAVQKWHEFERIKPAPEDTTKMKYIFDRYERDIIPAKATRTQRDNLAELGYLRKVFESAPIDCVSPQHIAQYRDKRGASAPTRANRELALLSHVWNMAREWGFTAKENPCRGVRKLIEKPRSFYADDGVWNAVYACAEPSLRDAMDLAYLTGQRPADIRSMRFSNIVNDALEVSQGKTGKKLRILLTDEQGKTALGLLIDRIKSRVIIGQWIISDNGKKMTESMLRGRFEKARAKAVDDHPEIASKIKQFQFRDARPKAASETDLDHASKLLGHSDKQITEFVYRRVGEVVKPMGKKK